MITGKIYESGSNVILIFCRLTEVGFADETEKVAVRWTTQVDLCTWKINRYQSV